MAKSFYVASLQLYMNLDFGLGLVKVLFKIITYNQCVLVLHLCYSGVNQSFVHVQSYLSTN